MDKEKVPPIIGAVLLVVGILVVFFVFMQAMAMVTNVGDYFREQFPEAEGEEEVVGPTAAFSWNTNDLEVNFQDESEPGDSDIRHWEWNFGDGDSSNQQHPSHNYNSDGDYRISLRVEDQNGNSDSINSNIYVDFGNFDNGQTEDNFGDMSFEFGMGGILTPIAAALLVGILFIVMFLVGAAMIKAGWNLIKPGPSTLKLKIKPKKLEVEQAQPESTYSPQHAPSPKSSYAQPEPAYQPKPTPDAVIAAMQALPANQPPQQTSYAQGNQGYYEQQSYASHGPTQPLPQNPVPPSPSFDSQPSQETQDNTPHPDQTDIGAYQSNPKIEEPAQATPAPEVSKPQPSTPKTTASSQKVEAKQPQATTNSTNQGSSSQTYKSRPAAQPAQRTSISRSRQNTRSRQQPRKSQQSNKRTQNKRRQNAKAQSKKGKGRKKK